MKRTVKQWKHLATEGLHRLLQEQGALVRPEAEAILSETSWTRDAFRLPDDPRPQPHHITTAHTRLVNSNDLVDKTAILNKRAVTVWVDAQALSTRGRKTEVSRAEATKRRLYRTYLGWTSDTRLCGQAAEQTVYASMYSRRGIDLLLKDEQPGNVKEIANNRLPFGTLDLSGYWLKDPSNPLAGLIPFAAEIKNMRRWIYPWDHELWGLLAKLSDINEVIPVLIARRIHPITFKFFKKIGVIGHQTKKQWFTSPGALPTQRHHLSQDKLYGVANALSMQDITFLNDPTTPQPSVETFFSKTPYKQINEHTLATRSIDNWNRASPIIKAHSDLRKEIHLQERRIIWAQFRTELKRYGLDISELSTFD